MKYGIKILPSAVKELASLPIKIQKRFASRIDGLAENQFPANAKLLKGSEDTYRLRVGGSRAIYRVMKKYVLVLVIKIGHRKDIYRKR